MFAASIDNAARHVPQARDPCLPGRRPTQQEQRWAGHGEQTPAYRPKCFNMTDRDRRWGSELWVPPEAVWARGPGPPAGFLRARKELW